MELSLFSAYPLLSAYYLTVYIYRCMHLTTGVYGISETIQAMASKFHHTSMTSYIALDFGSGYNVVGFLVTYMGHQNVFNFINTFGFAVAVSAITGTLGRSLWIFCKYRYLSLKVCQLTIR